MTDRPIPESIMRAARDLAESISQCGCDDCIDSATDRLSCALMDRDERAARIATNRAPATQDMTSTFIAEACDSIASAILSEGE